MVTTIRSFVNASSFKYPLPATNALLTDFAKSNNAQRASVKQHFRMQLNHKAYRICQLTVRAHRAFQNPMSVGAKIMFQYPVQDPVYVCTIEIVVEKTNDITVAYSCLPIFSHSATQWKWVI